MSGPSVNQWEHVGMCCGHMRGAHADPSLEPAVCRYETCSCVEFKPLNVRSSEWRRLRSVTEQAAFIGHLRENGSLAPVLPIC